VLGRETAFSGIVLNESTVPKCKTDTMDLSTYMCGGDKEICQGNLASSAEGMMSGNDEIMRGTGRRILIRDRQDICETRID